jgi:CDP-paratose 2-epimerase
MKVLITGICGFAGSSLAMELKRSLQDVELLGLDNLSRGGSEINRQPLRKLGIRLFHGDIRNPSDLEGLPEVEWVIDAAANPSVLAGVSGQTSSRQLMEHNLGGTLALLEFCKRSRAGLIMLSTSRVYSLEALSAIPVEVRNEAFTPGAAQSGVTGLSGAGVAESFPTDPPLSLYGAAKLASEVVIREYGLAFDFPVHINRCGVLAGAGQFGKPDQGIFSFWIHSYRWKRPLKYIGFGGSGHQVRDCLHPRDLAAVIVKQLASRDNSGQVLNISGGTENSISLAQLSQWCSQRFGPHTIGSDAIMRKYDVPWLVLDSAKARQKWNWKPSVPMESVFDEIAKHAEEHPDWLEVSRD